MVQTSKLSGGYRVLPPEIKQRPDVFVERAGRKIAIEYQCANLAIEQPVQKNIFCIGKLVYRSFGSLVEIN